MIKDISASSIINSDLLVKEPVNEFYKKINRVDSSKIVLTGGKGVGKSVVLLNKEKHDVVRDDKSIFMQLEQYCILGRNSGFDDSFFAHYYEMIFANEILQYIKKNYELTYNKYFKEISEKLEEIRSNTYNYINNCEYVNCNFNKQMLLGDYSYQIIEKIKSVMDFNKLSLMIDRYDYMNIDDQKHFSNYFGMFDKVILSSSDKELRKENRSNIFLDDSYQFIDVDYGNDKEFVKEMLVRRIKEHNQNFDSSRKEKEIPLWLITDDMYEVITKNCNGNMKVMLSVIRDFALEVWFNKVNHNYSQMIYEICKQKVKYYDEVYDTMLNKPNLYLVKK